MLALSPFTSRPQIIANLPHAASWTAYPPLCKVDLHFSAALDCALKFNVPILPSSTQPVDLPSFDFGAAKRTHRDAPPRPGWHEFDAWAVAALTRSPPPPTQDVLSRFKQVHGNLFDKLHEKACFQLNDTHPTIGIAELMHLLVDKESLQWEEAWGVTTKVSCCAHARFG